MTIYEAVYNRMKYPGLCPYSEVPEDMKGIFDRVVDETLLMSRVLAVGLDYEIKGEEITFTKGQDNVTVALASDFTELFVKGLTYDGSSN